MSRTIKIRTTVGGGLLAIAALAAVPIWAFGQLQDKQTPAEPEEITITGKVVDLQNFMTGNWVSSDHQKCTAECIRAGVPAALETEDGIYVLGAGRSKPWKRIAPYAFKTAEVTGRLYEKHNLRYVDVMTIRDARTSKPEQEGIYTPPVDDE